MSRSLSVRQITDDPLVNIIQDAGAQALREQGWWERRKNSLTAAAQVVMQLANLMITFTADFPWWVTVIIAAVIGMAEVVVHASARGPVTPAAVEKVERAAVRQNAPLAEDEDPIFSVYHSAG